MHERGRHLCGGRAVAQLHQNVKDQVVEHVVLLVVTSVRVIFHGSFHADINNFDCAQVETRLHCGVLLQPYHSMLCRLYRPISHSME